MNILGKDFTIFFNKICEIVGESVYVHSGEVAQVLADKMLVTWPLPDKSSGDDADVNRDLIVAKVADMATLSVLRIVREIQTEETNPAGLRGFLSVIKSNGAIPKFERLKIGFSLHHGYGFTGSLGS
jgi:hypothetical protein